MTTDLHSPERFSITPIIDAQDRLDTANIKLKAMINLVMEADLECFGNENSEGEYLRHGLGYILLEIADEHKKNIEILKAEYERCAEQGMRQTG